LGFAALATLRFIATKRWTKRSHAPDSYDNRFLSEWLAQARFLVLFDIYKLSIRAAVTIIELAEAVGETPRQIRYLIAEGLIAGPEGSRARPDYSAVHVEAIRRYQALRQEGMKPSQVKALLEAERLRQDGGQFTLAPGVVLSIDLNRLDPKTSPRAIGDLAAAALTHLLLQTQKDTPDAA
jgi:DNA-binding transcriptional MerR regulator